jgi:hypothetical protein
MKNYLKITNKKTATLKACYYFFSLMAAALFFAIIIFSQGQYKAQAAPNSAIRFEPAAATVAKDQEFSLDAKINPGTNQIAAVEVHITFDAAKFQMTNIVASSAFRSILQDGTYDNVAGTASIILGVPTHDPPAPVITDSTVATITMKAIVQNGTFPVAFTTGTRAADINEIGINAIITWTPSQITIGRKFGNADFAILASDWLQTKTSEADVNTDGKVNTQDLGIMMSSWEVGLNTISSN